MTYLSQRCNLIVTCTPSKSPLIFKDYIRKGTHITAVGSDTPEKQELESEILKIADKVIVDSISQVKLRGESYHALRSNLIKEEGLVELGEMIVQSSYHRTSEDEITVVDLTGVAVQDLQISKAVYEALK